MKIEEIKEVLKTMPKNTSKGWINEGNGWIPLEQSKRFDKAMRTVHRNRYKQ